MFDPAFRAITLVSLLIAGSILLHPGFDAAIGNSIGNHVVLIVFLGLVILFWRPIFWAVRLFLEGFFLGEGVKHSGVLRGLFARRGWR